MHDHYRLDVVIPVGGQFCLDVFRVDAMAPVTVDKLDVQAEVSSDAFPQRGEMTRFEHQDLVPGRQRVDQCGFPGAGTRGGIYDHVARGFKNLLQALQDFECELGEFRTAVVHGRHIHRAQDAVRHIGRPRNLQKMASA